MSRLRPPSSEAPPARAPGAPRRRRATPLTIEIIETTAVELPAEGLTPLWAALPSEPAPGGEGGAVLPFATTLRRVG